MDKKDTNDYIDLVALCSRLLRFFKIFWPTVLLLACILAGVFGAVALKPPVTTYSSKITFTYGVKSRDATEYDYSLSEFPKAQDIDRISESFSGILETKIFKNALKEKLDKDTVNADLSVTFSPSTNLGILYSSSSNEDDVIDALNATLEVFPYTLRSVIGPIELHVQGEPEPIKKTVEGLPLIPLIAAGFIVGLFLGLGILSLLAFTRNEISTKADVVRNLSLTVLGELPFLKSKGSIPLLSAMRSKGFLSRKSIKTNPELVVTDTYHENLRLIATQITEALKNNNSHSLLIMSTKRFEGKTVFAKALEKELFDSGWKIKRLESTEELRCILKNRSEEEIILLDIPATTTSDLVIWEAAELVDTSLLLIKSGDVLPQDALWGLHYLKNCNAKCIGVVLNACI